MSTCQGFLLRKFVTCSAVHSCSAGAWVNSAHAPEICRPCVLKPLCHSAFEVLLMFKKIAYRPISASDLETHWCCVERIVKLCVFLNFFVTTSLSTEFSNYPTLPHLLQLYHMMQDLRGRMQRSVMEDVGWASHEGHVSWAVVCRSSVALCAVDFFHCSTVGARDCFSAVEFIDNCSFRTSIFVGTSFVCEDRSMLETLGWRKRAVAGAGIDIRMCLNILDDYPWLNLIMAVLHVFHI